MNSRDYPTGVDGFFKTAVVPAKTGSKGLSRRPSFQEHPEGAESHRNFFIRPRFFGHAVGLALSLVITCPDETTVAWPGGGNDVRFRHAADPGPAQRRPSRARQGGPAGLGALLPRAVRP